MPSRTLLTNASTLTETELSDFDKDGFLMVRSLFSPREIAKLSTAVNGLACSAAAGRWIAHTEENLLRPGIRILSRIENFADERPELDAYARDPRIVARVSDLLQEPAVLFKEKIVFKEPGGAGFKPHQDIQPAGWDEYGEYFISALVAIDPATPDNGCIELAAGHHKEGLLGRMGQPLSEDELRGVVFQKFPMAPGDVVFFDCFAPHRSGPNLTSGPRRALYVTFNGESEGDQRKRYFDHWQKLLTLRRRFPFLNKKMASWRLTQRS
jgi:2-aminoethylphosphonate dioxygenase